MPPDHSPLPSPMSASLPQVGTVVDHVPVRIGPRFLELFSQQLYSSTNKAFEELVSNSWDAGARTVYVGVPEDLGSAGAAIWVLDDGESMDVDGLHALWRVGASAKTGARLPNGRIPIGRFGIGKLATYLLAREITYVCKAADGLIRTVTMDYGRVDQGASNELHLDELRLPVREIKPDELAKLLAPFAEGKRLFPLLLADVPKPIGQKDPHDDFGGEDFPSAIPSGTWTLALLTGLREAASQIKIGRVRWLLRTALPLGSSLSLVLNETIVTSSKIDATATAEWTIGPGLDLGALMVDGVEWTTRAEADSVYLCPPAVEMDGQQQAAKEFGPITGKFRLYAEPLSGHKSDTLGFSNGYLVNVRGRVVNLDDPAFGIEDHRHGTWPRFRATVRADGLHEYLTVNRQDFVKGTAYRAFQAFLRSLFNKARALDERRAREFPKAGEILTKAWGVLPLQPLSQLVLEGLQRPEAMPSFVDGSGVSDFGTALEQWEEAAAERPGDLIAKVEFGELSPEAGLVKYDLAGRRIVVNKNHPFALENDETEEQRRLLLDAALVDLLTQAYMVNRGIDRGLIDDAWEYRDRTFRILTQVNRRSAAQITRMLLDSTDHADGFEIIVTEALRHLGFEVEHLANPGEPEGVATAPTPPAQGHKSTVYSFTYDAKSSQDGKVQTKDVAVAGLVKHRDDHDANHILVVAPDYQAGGLVSQCRKHGVTPMRANALATLLMLAATTGPLDLVGFRTVFELADPDEVQAWVTALVRERQKGKRVPLDVFLSALSKIGYRNPNSVTTSVIADRISQLPGVTWYPPEAEVRNLVAGLSVLVPELIQIQGEQVYLTTTPQKLRDAIKNQIAVVPPDYRFGLEATIEVPVPERKRTRKSAR